MKTSFARRVVAEFLGTALLVAAVVGSGIMGERLAGGNVAVALLANTVATGAALVALILTFGPISGAHFNPAVTFADVLEGGLPWREAPHYILGQILGGIVGAISANLMFGLPSVSVSQHARSGPAQVFSEFVATFGLLAVIWGCSRLRSSAVAFAVGAYITAAYWFTSSTSFANPAVTIARTLSNTFSGIRPSDVPLFLLAQIVGAFAATVVFRWLVPTLPKHAKQVVVVHEADETSWQLSDALFRWNWIGFGVAVAGGFLLFSVSAETYLTNVAFLTKLGVLLPLGLVLHIVIQKKAPVWETAHEKPLLAKVAGIAELLLWVSVATAAVLIPYVG